MRTLALLSQLLLLGLGTFLMIVILLQRGRGGGLAGAFGGLGGQSAFGTKAGDVFTKITIVLAVAWVIVAGGSGYFLRAGAEERAASGLGESGASISAGEETEGDGEFDPSSGTPATNTLGSPDADAAATTAGDDADGAPATGADTAESDPAVPSPAEDAKPASQDDASGSADEAATPENETPAETSETPQQQ